MEPQPPGISIEPRPPTITAVANAVAARVWRAYLSGDKETESYFQAGLDLIEKIERAQDEIEAENTQNNFSENSVLCEK